MKIFVHFETNAMRWNIKTPNPKNYPYKQELIKLLWQKGHSIIGVPILPISELVKRVKEDMDTFISIDSFLPHMAHYYGKSGFVIFGQSDPKIFGYPDNINILKDEKNLRINQFWNWEQTDYLPQVFPTAQEVLDIINQYI